MHLLPKQFWRRPRWVFLIFLYSLATLANTEPSTQNTQVNSRDREFTDALRLSDFQKKFSELRRNASALSKNSELQNYEYVFIGGFANELYRKTYFSDMAKTLTKNNGVSIQQIHMIFPSSLASTKINGNLLKDEIERIKKTSSRKIIIVGHSMGGEIALRMFLENPNALSDQQIKYVVTVQAPLKGTDTAKIMDDLENGIYKLSRIVHYVGERISCKFDANSSSYSREKSGLHSITPGEANKVLTSTIPNLTSEDRSEFNSKVFYVSSKSTYERTKLGTYIIYEANDGTVPNSSQYINAVGRRLADLPDIGHTDLVLTGIKSSLTPRTRQAFAQTLFESLLIDAKATSKGQ